MNRTILVTGGSGFIGTELSKSLLNRGDYVIVVGRTEPCFTHERLSFFKAEIGRDELPQDRKIDAVIHLAGEPIVGRWTRQKKRAIYDSRIEGTKALVDWMGTLEYTPKVFVSASAMGYYGDAGEKECTEKSPPGKDFLARVCIDWEKEAREAEKLGVRCVQIRTANVIGPGGLLKSLTPIFKRGLGGWFGTGKQWFPWIHIQDIVGVYVHALDVAIEGPVNATAPEQVRQKYFMKTLGDVLRRPVWISIPIIIVRLRYGSFVQILTNSARLSSKKIYDSGYVFGFPKLKGGLEAALRQRK